MAARFTYHFIWNNNILLCVCDKHECEGRGLSVYITYRQTGTVHAYKPLRHDVLYIRLRNVDLNSKHYMCR